MGFADNLAFVAHKTGNDLEDIVKKFTFEVCARVIMRSPVDTGRFRANWQLSIDGIDSGTTEDTDKGPVRTDGRGNSVTKDQIEAAILENKLVGHEIFLTNSLPYAAVLEFGLYPNPPKSGTKTINGYSTQAPQGMVRLSIQEVESLLDQAVKSLGGK